MTVELQPEAPRSEPPKDDDEEVYEEVIVVKMHGRGRPKKVKEEELAAEGEDQDPFETVFAVTSMFVPITENCSVGHLQQEL